ncbi:MULTISPECIES: hypothetical protein [unclassified Bradyrhizobium]|uniref:hypothetical protein n=1 Tax=unclassified Bradyrhizobium TaxID=2631580 RepID=UPI00093C6271|nr:MULTISPECIES: hypothetical protein [unclassified Bradyrhizobium]OKO68944.1 hypothetical protein AC629_41760 [Bradyrhizobium sp. NAS80.1]OKO86302.1 hypothetical protein AC630_03310 [Bradyrhizobium sp. AS23.2]
MTNHSCLALAAVILAASIIGAAAQDNGAPMSTDTQHRAPGAPLHLSPEQEKAVWQHINSYPIDPPPSQLTLPVGAVLPKDLPLMAIPDEVAAEVSSLKGYDCTIMHDRLLIVNRLDKTVAYVIDGTLRRNN